MELPLELDSLNQKKLDTSAKWESFHALIFLKFCTRQLDSKVANFSDRHPD